MKVAIITDSHAGARSDSLFFDAQAEEFFTKTFFPHLKEHHITDILHLGDLFERRKFINFQILQNIKRYFFDPIIEDSLHLSIIAGNHDTYFKNTNEVNSLDLLLTEYEYSGHVSVYRTCQDVVIDNQLVTFVPWICDENREATMKHLKATKSKICMGHLELAGFEMQKGMGAHTGDSPEIFSKFDIVLSGHYHHKSTIGNINYLGCPFEFTWSDYEDQKGFHIFDTKTHQLEFIPNPATVHVKAVYDDQQPLPNPKEFKNKIVKLIVSKKENYEKFDAFMDQLYKSGVIDVKVLEDYGELSSDIDEKVQIEDTSVLLDEYIDGMEIEADKDRLKAILKELYIEALYQED